MIIDELLEFADATSVIASTGRNLIGDVVDLGSEPQDYGNGRPMYLVVQVSTAVDSATNTAAISFELASDAAAAIATDGSATEHLVTEAIPQASLVAGYRRVFALPVGASAPYEQYLGVIANISGEAVTAGAIDAFLTYDPVGWQAYPDAVN